MRHAKAGHALSYFIMPPASFNQTKVNLSKKAVIYHEDTKIAKKSESYTKTTVLRTGEHYPEPLENTQLFSAYSSCP